MTAREIALVVGSEFIRSTFGPVADLPGVGYAQDEQVGRPVSCMATTVEGQDLRLCTTAEGYVTQITAGTTQALATEVSDEVPDVRPRAARRAAVGQAPSPPTRSA